MAMLVLAFPSMKILWSRSPHATAGIFRSLKINHDEPDEIEAQRIGQDEAIAVESVDGVSNKRGKHNQDRETALELLLTLPGVNLTNVKGITRQVASIAALCRLDEGQLTALLGPANARKLYVFLHHRVTIGYGVI
jgi:DNA excision repair protein ERCC-4